MKRCVDCKHCSWPPFATGADVAVARLAECTSSMVAGRTSMVLDSALVIGRDLILCTDARRGACREDGQFFEPHGREPGV